MLLLALLAFGCGAKAERGDGPGLADASADVRPAPPPESGVPLPFVVDDHFYPSGCYAEDGGCPAVVDTGKCADPQRRPEGAQGQCYRFDYSGEQAWGGVFFQNTDEQGAANWGTGPGVLIAPGARQMSFYAASSPPGQLVRFKVGGIDDPDFPYRDTLDVELSATLGGELQHYVISLEGLTYDYVLSGFSWHIDRAGEEGKVVIMLDDMRWE